MNWRKTYADDEALASAPDSAPARLERLLREVDRLIGAGRSGEAVMTFAKGLRDIPDRELERQALCDLVDLCRSSENLRPWGPAISSSLETVARSLGDHEQAAAVAIGEVEFLREAGERNATILDLLARIEAEYSQVGWMWARVARLRVAVGDAVGARRCLRRASEAAKSDPRAAEEAAKLLKELGPEGMAKLAPRSRRGRSPAEEPREPRAHIPSGPKVRWSGRIVAVQPRIRLLRSCDERSHSYLGYVLTLEGQLGEDAGRRFSVAIGPAAEKRHQFRVGDDVSATSRPVADPEREVAGYYETSELAVRARGEVAASADRRAPYHIVPPPIEVYRAHGHHRLDPRTYETKCATCAWACKMPVEMIVDHWNRSRGPDNVKRRFETFCYGPKGCPLYRPGPVRKVPGRKGMVHEDDGDSTDEVSGTGDEGWNRR